MVLFVSISRLKLLYIIVAAIEISTHNIYSEWHSIIQSRQILIPAIDVVVHVNLHDISII